MENITNVGDEHGTYLHVPYLLGNQENSRTIYRDYDSSSPYGAPSSSVSRSIVSERLRRQQLNQRIFSLREAVPNITKMDKASTIKDAIVYIQQLQEELAKTQTEIMEMEINNPEVEEQQQQQPLPMLLGSHNNNVFNSASYPIQLLKLEVKPMGDNILLVNLSCTKRQGTIVKLCQLFESFNLKIITANIIAIHGALLNTLFIEADEREKDGIKIQIETAIAALVDPPSPMAMMS